MGAVGKCDIGRVRKINEDSIYISKDSKNKIKYYIVADGMGGHNAGEVASQSAIKFFNEYLESKSEVNENSEILDLLIDALNDSNLRVYEMAENNSAYCGMGTTFTAAAIVNDKMYCVHIGDSRVYIFDQRGIRQITKDHSFVMEMVRMGKITLEEARIHPKRNIITKAVGIEKNMPADTYIQTLDNDSVILICSDGLSSMVSDKDMETILKQRASLEKKAEMLVELANKNGGSDNISVILVDRRVDN